MDIKQNPFSEQLADCISSIEELKEQLVTKRALKNSLLTSMEKFYTDELRGIFFKQKSGEKLGQISHVFTKNGKLFVRLYFLEMTAKSKLIKNYSNFELFGGVMMNLVLLSESEYKEAFFDYVSNQIESVRNETNESEKEKK